MWTVHNEGHAELNWRASSHPMAVEFTVRAATLDYYMAKPSTFDVSQSWLTGSSLARVPVVRIFGATPDGQRCCMHVHQAFPYCYVPCFDDMPDPAREPEEARQLYCSLARQIDEGIAPSVPNDDAAGGGGAGDGQQRSPRATVVSISVVKGLPFYGYTSAQKSFLKIEVCHPSSIGRMAAMLQAGAFLGRPLQPFEAHIPFVLQFMIDQNIAGMDMVRARVQKNRPLASRLAAAAGDCCGVRFRPPLPQASEGMWNIGGGWQISHHEKRQSRCTLHTPLFCHYSAPRALDPPCIDMLSIHLN